MVAINRRHRRIVPFRAIQKGVLFLLIGGSASTATDTFGSNANNEDGKMTIHRIFPAAKREFYNPENMPPILGVLSSGVEFSVSTTFESSLDPYVNDSSRTSGSIDKASARNGGSRRSSSTSSNRNHLEHAKKVDDILDPAIARFRKSLKRFPEFHEEYPVNPGNLPLVPIRSTFSIALGSADVDLYHGVPEDYEIFVRTDSVASRTDGALERDGSGFAHNGPNRLSSLDRNHQEEHRSIVVSINASTVFGVLRALESLGQLLQFGWMDDDENDGDGIFVIPDIPLYISDEPAFPYRGLMIDTARHYLPMNLILDNLDAMAMNKMNVLHWHISDSNSFPYAPKDLPELANKGAYHPKRIYTPENVRTLIREAYLRGIRVIPEIDMPGHTNAIAASHPEVMSHCPHPSEPMNPTVPETYDFIFQIYRDLNANFPDQMWHLGGDEVQLSEACWLKDPLIAKWMKDRGMGNKTVELYEYFETNLLKTISGFGKTPVVWQEVFNLNLTIPEDAIIDVWKGFDKYTIQNATMQGHRVILSGCWYLDHLDQTWQKFYACDPLNFTSPHKNLMIGGHASMWGEHVDASNFMSRVWPRASSAAERLWHGTTGREARDAAANIAKRIHEFRCRMVRMGFGAGPTGPGVCPTEVAYATPREKREASTANPRTSDSSVAS